MNLLTPSVQVPPLRHGLPAHSLMFVLQVAPLKPAAHEQVNMLMPSVQVPPLRHGLFAHSLMLMQALDPVPLYPAGQGPHVRPPGVFVHVASVSQPPWLTVHSSMSTQPVAPAPM